MISRERRGERDETYQNKRGRIGCSHARINVEEQVRAMRLSYSSPLVEDGRCPLGLSIKGCGFSSEVRDGRVEYVVASKKVVLAAATLLVLL